MKLLILTQSWYPDSFSGSAHVASEQARRLASRGYDVTVMTEWIDPLHPAQQQESKNLRIVRYGTPAAFARYGSSIVDLQSLPKRLETFLPDEQFDAAILHHVYPSQGFFWARPTIPSLYIFHASTAREAEVEGLKRKFRGPLLLLKYPAKKLFIAVTRRMEQQVLQKVNRIAVFSEYSRGILEGSYPEVLSKVGRVGVGIDTELFHPAADHRAAKKRLGFSPEEELLLTVRRLTPRMGIPELIKAMTLVAERRPRALLVVIGEGPLKEKITTLAEHSSLKGRVQVLGRVSLKDLPQYYRAADLFVLPTEAFEGLGMATLEALASGLPVVGTPAGATPEILGKLDARLITKGIRAEDLAEGIVSFLDLPEEKKKHLRIRAREVVLRDYQWDRAMDELEVLLKGVMKKPKGKTK